MLYLLSSSFSLLYLFWTLNWFAVPFHYLSVLSSISSGLWSGFLLYLFIIILSSPVSLLGFGLVFSVPFHHHPVFSCISSKLWTGFCCTFPLSICPLLYLFWTLDWFLLYLSIIILSLLYLFWTLDWFCCNFPSSFCLYCISSGLWTGFLLYLSIIILPLLYLFWTLDWFFLYLSIIILSSPVSLLDFGLVFTVPFHHHPVLSCISSGLWTGFCCTFPSSSCPLLYLIRTLDRF